MSEFSDEDERMFLELMQTYRRAPVNDQRMVIAAYEAVRAFFAARNRLAADPALRVVGNNVDHGELLHTVYLTGNEMEALRTALNIVSVCTIYDTENTMPRRRNERAEAALAVLSKLTKAGR